MYATPRLFNRGASADFADGCDCVPPASRPRMKSGTMNKQATTAPRPSVVNRGVFNTLLSHQWLCGRLPGAFFQRDDLIGAHILKRICLPARPAHLHRIRLWRAAKAKG